MRPSHGAALALLLVACAHPVPSSSTLPSSRPAGPSLLDHLGLARPLLETPADAGDLWLGVDGLPHLVRFAGLPAGSSCHASSRRRYLYAPSPTQVALSFAHDGACLHTLDGAMDLLGPEQAGASVARLEIGIPGDVTSTSLPRSAQAKGDWLPAPGDETVTLDDKRLVVLGADGEELGSTDLGVGTVGPYERAAVVTADVAPAPGELRIALEIVRPVEVRSDGDEDREEQLLGLRPDGDLRLLARRRQHQESGGGSDSMNGSLKIDEEWTVLVDGGAVEHHASYDSEFDQRNILDDNAHRVGDLCRRSTTVEWSWVLRRADGSEAATSGDQATQEQQAFDDSSCAFPEDPPDLW